MPTSNSIDWQIESIRVTAFVKDKLNPDMLETWIEKVSENSPSQINKTSSSFTGVSRSTAGFIRTSWDSNRLDVILSSEQSQSSQMVAPISEVTSLFSRFVDRIPEIDELTPVDRLALGLILIFQVPSEPEGLEILSPSIVSLNLNRSARDFLYRVNHPCKSCTVDGLDLNRLATWSVGRVQLVRILIKPDNPQVQQTISEAPTAIRLELDINTDQAMKLGANLELLKNLLNELKTIAVNVAIGGEATMLE
ncbi:MAG: hypothetical protein LM513_03020 [Nitrospira sp.]|nr:hypothetical protein [Nitrospira sp.]